MWFTHDVVNDAKVTGNRYGTGAILTPIVKQVGGQTVLKVSILWLESANESASRVRFDPSVIRDANDGFPWVTRT